MAEAQTLHGMVWNPPGNVYRMQAELLEIRESGVDAVRIPYTENTEVYKAADSLGVLLYQDLPFEYLPTSALLDTLAHAKKLAREAVSWTNTYDAVRYYGLGRHNDTSDPDACRFFEEIISEVRAQSALPIQFYYSTTFIEDEQCAGTVDFILLEALNESNPVQVVERWYQAHPQGSMGIGALGTWIEARRDDADGYKLRNSPAFQARYLEDNLNTLLQTDEFGRLASLFVYRWSDIRLTYPSIAHNLKYPYRHTYGLKTNRGNTRSAYHVVKGIFTGEQTVFAFPVGQASKPGASWIILLGWFTVALIGIGYAYFPRLSPNVKRYFAAHGFYRSAVEEGRELLFGPTTLLLLAVMVAFGIAGTVILDTVRVTEAFSALVRWLPSTPRTTLVALLSNQLIVTLVLGSGFVVAVTVWTSILSATTARNRRRLLPGQTFMLVVWPQWPILVAMIAAMVISTLDNTYAPRLALALFIILFVAVMASSVRALRDFALITRPNFTQLLIAVLGNPFFLIVLVGIYICLQHMDKFGFFWHLIMRT